MLHMKWVVSVGAPHSPLAKIEELVNYHGPDDSGESKIPEKMLGELIDKMNPGQRKVFLESLGEIGQPASKEKRVPYKLRLSLVSPPPKVVRSSAFVKLAPDEKIQQRHIQVIRGLRSVYGSRVSQIAPIQ